MDQRIVDRLVVAVADGAVDTKRLGCNPRRHALEIGDDRFSAADRDAAAADPTFCERRRLLGAEAAAHPARIGRIVADGARGTFEKEMALRARNAVEGMALEHDVAGVRHHHLVVAAGARAQMREIDRIAPRMDRAAERARLKYPDHLDAAALEITGNAQAGPADE